MDYAVPSLRSTPPARVVHSGTVVRLTDIVGARRTTVLILAVKQHLAHVILDLPSVRMACVEHFLLMQHVRVALSGTAVQSMATVEALTITAGLTPVTPHLALVTLLL